MNTIIDKALGYWKHPASKIFFTQSLGNGIGLLTGIAVANYLSVIQKAEVDQFRLVVTFSSEIASLGLASGFLYYSTKEEHYSSKSFGSALVYALFLFALAIVAAFTTYDEASHFLKGIPLIIFRLAVLSAPFRLLTNMLYGLQQAIGKPIMYHFSGLLEGLIILGTVLGLKQWGTLNSEHVIIGSSIGILAGTGLSILGVVRHKIPPIWERATFKEMIVFGFPIYIGLILNYLHFRIDEVLINSYLGKPQFAVYSVSVRWAEMMFLIDSAILGASLQRIGSYSQEEGYRYSFKLFRIQTPIVILAAVGFLGLSYVMIFNLYLKPEYHQSWSIMALLLPGICSWSVARIFSQYLVYNRGKKYWMIWMNIVGLCLNLCLNLIFIPKYGLTAVALSSSVSYATVLLVVYLMMLKTKENGKTFA